MTFPRTSSGLFSPLLSSCFTVRFIWFVQTWDQILGTIRATIAGLMKPSVKAEPAHNLFATVLLCHFIVTAGGSSASAVVSLEPRRPRQHERRLSVSGFPLALWSGCWVWGSEIKAAEVGDCWIVFALGRLVAVVGIYFWRFSSPSLCCFQGTLKESKISIVRGTDNLYCQSLDRITIEANHNLHSIVSFIIIFMILFSC